MGYGMERKGAQLTEVSEGAFEGVHKISRVTLHETVLNKIRDMIIEGKLAPGSRINEVYVGTMLGVSRTPLREAIKSLSSEGLIDIVPAKGAIVRKFSLRDIGDILETLKIMEQAAARLVCARASDETIAELIRMHERMLLHYLRRERLPYFKLNQEIHAGIVRAAGNEILFEAHQQLQARIKRIRFIGNEEDTRWAGAVDDHEQIMKALLTRDGDGTAEALGLHLDRTLVRIRDATGEAE
jgi:DNA-binding GntR family transcriptional regulator